MRKSHVYPNATKDEQGRLKVAAAIGVGEDGISREQTKLLAAEVDLIVVDTAHGHSEKVLSVVNRIKKYVESDVQILAGNVATKDAVKAH